ncbi:MAG: copper homeostasis protein CutC [Acidobacteriaceae bacterium]
MAVIEIAVDSTESALAAEQGGAQRIELCSALREGGLTSSLGLVRTVRSACSIALFTIIRPRGSDFLYTADEFRTMQEDIRIMGQEGVDGVVFGLLTQDGNIDKERTRALVELACPMQVTFHRALDMTSDPEQALEDVIACGVQRVLTSGCASSAWAGRKRLQAMVQQAAGRITIVIGGGVRPANISRLKASTGATEFHSSMRRRMPSPMRYQARQLNLGETGLDEFTRNLVLAEEVHELLAATRSKDTNDDASR